jgi:hypothetical protein
MKRVSQASKPQLHGFVREAVELGSTVCTDRWEGYVGMEALDHRPE